jgi:hypothetical protein
MGDRCGFVGDDDADGGGIAWVNGNKPIGVVEVGVVVAATGVVEDGIGVDVLAATTLVTSGLVAIGVGRGCKMGTGDSVGDGVGVVPLASALQLAHKPFLYISLHSSTNRIISCFINVFNQSD